MSQFEHRVVHEFSLETPTNWTEVDKMLVAAGLLLGKDRSDDAVTIRVDNGWIIASVVEQ